MPSSATPSEIGRRSLLYLIGNAISGAVLFLLIPLHTTFLDPSEYGRFDLDVGFVYLAISIAFLDINQVILRFTYLEERPGLRTRPLYSALPVLVAGLPVYIAAMLLLSRFVPVRYPGLLIVLGLITKWVDVYGVACRGLGRTKEFVLAEIVYAACVVLTTVLLMIGLGLKLPALYLAAIAGYACQLAYLEIRLGLIRRFSRSLVSRDLTVRMVRYAMPLVLNVLAYWVLNRFARVVIARELSLAENGLYSVAAGVALALTVLARNFMRAWQEAAFSLREDDERRTDYFSRALAAFVTILGAVYVVMVPAVTALYPFIFGSAYHAGVAYVAPALLAVMLQALDMFLSHIHGHVLDNRVVVASTLSGAAVTVVFATALVRALGVNGASLSICLGFAVAVGVKAAYLRRRVGLRVHLSALSLTVIGIALASVANLAALPVLMIGGGVALVPAAQMLRRARNGSG